MVSCQLIGIAPAEGSYLVAVPPAAWHGVGAGRYLPADALSKATQAATSPSFRPTSSRTQWSSIEKCRGPTWIGSGRRSVGSASGDSGSLACQDEPVGSCLRSRGGKSRTHWTTRRTKSKTLQAAVLKMSRILQAMHKDKRSSTLDGRSLVLQPGGWDAARQQLILEAAKERASGGLAMHREVRAGRFFCSPQQCGDQALHLDIGGHCRCARRRRGPSCPSDGDGTARFSRHRPSSGGQWVMDTGQRAGRRSSWTPDG